MPEPDGPALGHRRSRAWAKVSHGLFRPRTADDTWHSDLAAWQLVLPDSGAFTHLTAARQLGWWLPPLPDDLPVFASIAKSDNRPRRAGLRVTRHPYPIEVQPIDGLRLAAPAEILLACARDLRLLDMVVLVDAALHQGSCTRSDIDAVLSQRRIGGPMLRAASERADGRSESAWETMLRMLHEVCDVSVEPQFVLEDDAGGFVARGDLRITGTTTLHEYDGGEHRKKRRHRKDLARERRIGNMVWTRRGYTDAEVLHQGVSILRDADRSLGREHRPERIRAWHALLAESMFTPGGMASACRRWGIDPTVGGQESQPPGA